MTRRRPGIAVVVSDHAVLRWLQQEHGLDIERIRKHLRYTVHDAAEYGAIAMQTGKVRLQLRDELDGEATKVVVVDVTGRAKR